MKVFRLAPTGAQEHLDLVREADHEALMRVNGTPIATQWAPLDVTLDRTAELGGIASPTDFPYLKGDVLIASGGGLSVVEQLGSEVCEILPLRSNDGEFALVNIIAVVDALDEEASWIDRFSSGRIMSIFEYAFHREALEGVTLFRLKGYERGTFYLTDVFLQRAQAAGCVGPEVERIWPTV